MGKKPNELALEKGLPSSVETERLTLGSVLVRPEAYPEIAAILTPDSFALEKHRRIFRAMGKLFDARKPIDYITLAEALMESSELESCDGLTYLTSLDTGLPKIQSVAAYAAIIKEKEVARQVILLSQHSMNQMLTGEISPKECIQTGVQKFLELLPDEKGSGPQEPGTIIETFEGGINAFLQPHLRPRGLPTGFTKFDEMTGGLSRGELVILAARPSMGKTSAALDIASYFIFKHAEPVLIFSLEMARESLLERMVCSRARVDSQRFRQGYVNTEERSKLQKAANEIVAAPLLIDDTSSITPMQILSRKRQWTAKKGKIPLTIVDYLQLMQGGKHENRNQEVSALSRTMKMIAKDEDTCMLVLSQLNRAPETRPGDHRPQLSDLRESGAIEQDADLVAFIFRPEVYSRDRDDLHGLAELLIAKQRNGPCGKVDLVFLHGLMKFENRTDDSPDDQADFKNRAAGDKESA